MIKLLKLCFNTTNSIWTIQKRRLSYKSCVSCYFLQLFIHKIINSFFSFKIRTPDKYHGLILPRKLPPRSTPLAIHQLPMLGFLEQTVSEAVIKALTSVGCFKPKYPFLTARRSALLYVAYHLKGELLSFH